MFCFFCFFLTRKKNKKEGRRKIGFFISVIKLYNIIIHWGHILLITSLNCLGRQLKRRLTNVWKWALCTNVFNCVCLFFDFVGEKKNKTKQKRENDNRKIADTYSNNDLIAVSFVSKHPLFTHGRVYRIVWNLTASNRGNPHVPRVPGHLKNPLSWVELSWQHHSSLESLTIFKENFQQCLLYVLFVVR